MDTGNPFNTGDPIDPVIYPNHLSVDATHSNSKQFSSTNKFRV
jgi:hypothetical protein